MTLQQLLEQRRDQARKTAEQISRLPNADMGLRIELDGLLDDWDRAVRALDRLTDEGSRSDPYGPRSPYSFFGDLRVGKADPSATERLNRYREQRSAGSGALAGLVIPQYLTELAAPIACAGRPFADLIGSPLPIPDQGMQVDFSKVTAGASAASQSSENASVSTTDYTATDTSIPVRTIAVRVDISRQLRDRTGPTADLFLAADCLAAWGTELDRQIIAGSGASGEVTGTLNAASVQSVTWTDASPTAAKLVQKVAYAARLAADARKLPMTCVVLAPRRWYWLCKELEGTTNAPIVSVSLVPPAPGSPFVGSIAGMGVLIDGSVPLNLGSGTNEDRVIVCRPSDLALLESEPVVHANDQTSVSTLGVLLELTGCVAFSAARYPTGIGVVSGTGLVDPGAW